MYKPSQEASDKYAADVAAAADRGKLLDAARAADTALRAAEARRAPITELHGLAKELGASDPALTRPRATKNKPRYGARAQGDGWR